MSWRDEWDSLADRIDGLIAAGDLFFESLPNVRMGDHHSVSNTHLLPAGRAIREDLVGFQSSHQHALPAHAQETLHRYIDKSAPLADRGASGIPGVQGLLVSLAVFRAEFGHAINDAPTRTRDLVTRALQHLQRSIVADRHIRGLWQEAFGEGEPSLEKLGATHLLIFGVWAFKCSASGERTDLVLGGRLTITQEVHSAAEGLVLTEWKRVTASNETEPKVKEAFVQARLYSEGILAGFELAYDRYILIVSQERLTNIETPLVDDGVNYHVRNIAVSPAVPSMEARRQAGGT